MKTPPPDWEKLAGLAGKARHPEGAPPSQLAKDIAAAAMKNASLKSPGAGAIFVGWLKLVKVWLPLVVGTLLLGGWLLQSRPNAAERAAAQYSGWSGETLRQLRSWYPLECENAGEIGLLMQSRVEQLTRLGLNSPEAKQLLSSTEQELLRRLTPEQQAQFRAEQAKLRARWFPAR